MKFAATMAVAVAAAAPATDPIAAASALLQRVLPTRHSQFSLELLSAPSSMQLDSAGGKIVLRGSGAVELASALNWYFNDYLSVCNNRIGARVGSWRSH